MITEDNKPMLAIECKLSDGDTSKSLRYFKQKFPDCEAIQLSAFKTKGRVTKESIKHISAVEFLNTLV